MKYWQYMLGSFVVGNLGIALDTTGHPAYALPFLLLGVFGFIKVILIQKRREQ